MEELAPGEVSTEEVAPTEELTEKVPPIKETTDEMDPVEEPIEEPIVMKVPASKPAGESEIPPAWHEDKGKGEVLHSDYPGWTEVPHPAWSVTSAREIPVPASELRQRHCSQSVGGRRA